jgi:hypothetical protein
MLGIAALGAFGHSPSGLVFIGAAHLVVESEGQKAARASCSPRQGLRPAGRSKAAERHEQRASNNGNSMIAIEAQLIERLKKLPPLSEDEVEAENQAARQDA